MTESPKAKKSLPKINKTKQIQTENERSNRNVRARLGYQGQNTKRMLRNARFFAEMIHFFDHMCFSASTAVLLRQEGERKRRERERKWENLEKTVGLSFQIQKHLAASVCFTG